MNVHSILYSCRWQQPDNPAKPNWLFLPESIWGLVAHKLSLIERLRLLTTCRLFRQEHVIVQTFADNPSYFYSTIQAIVLQKKQNVAKNSILASLAKKLCLRSISYVKLKREDLLEAAKEPRLRKLILASLVVHGRALGIIDEMRSLHHLMLSAILLSVQAFEALREALPLLPQLSTIVLNHIIITPYGIPAERYGRGVLPLLQALPERVEKIAVVESILEDTPALHETLERFTSLRELVLRNVSELKGEHLQSLPTSLEFLLEDQNPLGDGPRAHLGRLTRLRELYLDRCKVTGAVLDRLSSTLRVVDLPNNSLSPLQDGHNLQRLEVLNLSGNARRLHPQTIQLLPLSLKGLALADKTIGDNALSELRHLTRLQMVDLRNNGLGGGTLEQLPSSLQKVLLNGNPIEPNHLATAQNLQLSEDDDPMKELTTKFSHFCIKQKEKPTFTYKAPGFTHPTQC